MKYIFADKFVGKRIRLSGYLKSKNVKDWAGFWLRVDKAGSTEPLAFDNMQNRGIKGATNWTKYEIVLDVSSNASGIAYGALLTGDGQIWFDSTVNLEVVDKTVSTTGMNYSIDTISNLKYISSKYLDSTRDLTKGNNNLNATYLTLNYELNNIDSVEWAYAEVRVPKGEAPLYTYYSVLGGSSFYSGIQVNSEQERRIIFSVWDAKGGNNNKNVTADSSRATLISADKNAFVDRFGNEGSGVHTHLIFDWKEDSIYKFLIHAVPNFIENSTTYTLFVKVDENWKMIAKIKTPHFSNYLKYAYSFLEDFSSHDDTHRRAVSYQNIWVRTVTGNWKEITQGRFYLPFGDKGRAIKDYGCGLSSNGFMLISGGGFNGTYIPTPALVIRHSTNIIPLNKMPE
ncbi:MAG: DUF3472 domain-containing protein [Arachidicoccus sp.]|nr:DUF3472 domain-containing protein [Arachidicoccus sp.]